MLPFILRLLDILLTIVHLFIIVFNLFGWIFPKTRRANFILILATAFSWFVLGIWFGFGYCPVTDWQWSIKDRLGERRLPSSFVTYYADKLTGKDISPSLINTVVAVSFAAAAIFSIYFNFFRKRIGSVRQQCYPDKFGGSTQYCDSALIV